MCLSWLMGYLCATPEQREQDRVNNVIEKQLKLEALEATGNQKLLLLGTGECGKSTILKQIKILHNVGFNPSDLKVIGDAVRDNCVQGMAQLIRARELFFHKTISDIDNDQRIILTLADGATEKVKLTQTYAALKRLWAEPSIRKVLERRNEFQSIEHIEYFMENLDRIHSASYLPTTEDILRVRTPTTGVVNTDFDVKGTVFSVVDVGGQRSERRKWIHQFDNVNAVIYICAISEYDQKMSEDEKTNRMDESIALFDKICNSRYFFATAMILFLNKKDLFEQKIKKKSMRTFFKNYAGPDEFSPCIAYITQQFENMNTNNKNRRIYTHVTCATDTNQVQLVIESVIDIVISKNLQGTGME